MPGRKTLICFDMIFYRMIHLSVFAVRRRFLIFRKFTEIRINGAPHRSLAVDIGTE